MRAFLSHSSSDKGYVQIVQENLRPGNYEFDSQTFDEGGLNADEIIKALNRCDLFCLFLSTSAIKSKYVDFEIAFSRELIASGKISRVLTICLDEDVFDDAKGFIKHYNMVRRPRTPESAARLIEGKLISSKQSKALSSHPFVGRESELKILEKQAKSLDKPRIKALYISGNSGAGRRTVAKKFFQNQYPEVGALPPTVELDSFEGYDDIYRGIVSALRPSISLSDLRELVKNFESADNELKAQIIADEINAIVHDRETLHIFDGGGLLREDGSFQPEIEAILDRVVDRPHPPIVFVSPRMIPSRCRRTADDIAYLSVPSLTREDSERLISGLLKDCDAKVKPGQLDRLVEVSDQHPYNIYRIVDIISSSSVDLFINNPRDYIDWKHKQTSEYLRTIALSRLDIRILSVFSIAPELDFTSLSDVLSDDSSADISNSVQNMHDLHVLRVEDDSISISRALRIASERDPRTDLKGPERTRIMRSLSKSLAVRVEDSEAPITLLDSAILATLESGAPASKLMEAFILPSHRVWLAKRYYDARKWKDSIRMAREAIEGRGRLSNSGAIAACRYLGLAAARVNDQLTFEFGIAQLKELADSNSSKSNIHFLRGFNLRLQGKLKEAYDELISAHQLSQSNRAASRELASVCLSLGFPEEAEKYAREAYVSAQNNPFIIDVLIACLIRNRKKHCVNDAEVLDLLDALKQIDAEEGRSFHSTRLAEIEYLYGDNKKALTLVQEALKKTPNLFTPLELYSKSLLKDGNFSKAKDQINLARKIIIERSAFDLRANYRPLLQLEAEYSMSVDDFSSAIEIYRDKKYFSDLDRTALGKEIETIKSYKGR